MAPGDATGEHIAVPAVVRPVDLPGGAPMSVVIRSLLALAACAVFAAPAAAQDRWDRHKGDCDGIFQGWRNAGLDRIADCVITWEMHRDVKSVGDDQKAIVHGAFDRLYQDGDRRQAHMALSALKRLDLRPRGLREDAKPRDRSAPEVAAERAPVARKIDPVLAQQLYSRGVRAMADGDVPGALALFLDAAERDPLYPQPLYRAAQAYVRLRKGKPAIEALARMKNINSDVSATLIERARTDPAFAGLERSSAFKALTGRASIQLLNAGGDGGKKAVLKFKARLEEAGIAVSSVAEDAKRRQNTYIFARPGFEQQGEAVRRELQLGLIHTRPIDWNTAYDVILVYGVRGESKWIDDEAEKGGQKAAADKKKAEAAKKKADDEAKAASKADMKKKLEMIKMMQDLEAEDAAGAADPTGGSGDPIDAL